MYLKKTLFIHPFILVAAIASCGPDDEKDPSKKDGDTYKTTPTATPTGKNGDATGVGAPGTKLGCQVQMAFRTVIYEGQDTKALTGKVESSCNTTRDMWLYIATTSSFVWLPNEFTCAKATTPDWHFICKGKAGPFVSQGTIIIPASFETGYDPASLKVKAEFR